MKKMLTIAMLFGAMLGHAEPQTVGQFVMEVEADNAFLPKRLVWNGKEILDAKAPLNFTFTDYTHRTKYYREENKHFWGGKPDARFVTDVTEAKLSEGKEKGYRHWQVDYTSSYAQFSRRIMLHETEARAKIVYQLMFSKDVVIHEPMYFGLMLQLLPAFSTRVVAAVDSEEFRPLQADGFKDNMLTLNPLNPGPTLLSAPELQAAVLVSYTWTGAAPESRTSRNWEIKAGQKMVLTANLSFANAVKELLPEMKRAATEMLPAHRAYQMFANANVLVQQGRVADGEQMLLRAATEDKTFSWPYSRLAQIRMSGQSRHKMSPAECFTYASYRQPYNYGWSLSGLEFPRDKRLTEEERRLAIFNQLISVENCQFYAEYYVWVAQHFEKMKMYAQAAAMTRQALWALERLPRPENYREKHRTKLQAKLDELEDKLINDLTAELPPLTEIDVRDRKVPK